MIYLIKGRQRVGKTTVSTGLCIDFVEFGTYIERTERGYESRRYETSDIVSNCHFYKPNGDPLPGYLYLENREMKAYMRNLVKSGERHKIIHIDEIDRVFSHRFWGDKEQADALLGLWQDEKLGHRIVGTAHMGRSVDNLIRESMQIEIIVLRAVARLDRIEYGYINILNREVGYGYMSNVSTIQRCFDSLEPIK